MTLLLLLGLVRPPLTPVGPAELAAMQSATLERESRARRPFAAAPRPGDEVPGQFVVGYRPESLAAVRAWAEAAGARVLRLDEAGRFAVLDVPAAAAADLPALAATARSVPGVRYAEPDIAVHACAVPNDPLFLQYQWDKWVMYADEAWDLAGGSMSLKVAVVDNGCDYTHPDLAAMFVSGQLGYDFINNDADPKPDHPEWDEAFHGTHVSGIIAAQRDNGLGVAGWSQVQLLAVRVLNDSGSGNTSTLATGIRWAVDNGARVINMSLGATSSATPVDEACQYAAQAGVLMAAASGNDGTDFINFPAGLNECIAVGATDKDSRLANFSNYGPEQELVAPGVTVASTAPGGAYVLASGTSMATPEVSGVAALVMAAYPSLSANQVRSLLAASAVDMGSLGRDETYGYGMVNGRRALELAGAFTRSATPQPAPAPPAGFGRSASLPEWADRAAAYDGAGRLVGTWSRGGAGPELEPGVYFVTLSGAGRTGRLKVVIGR